MKVRPARVLVVADEGGHLARAVDGVLAAGVAALEVTRVGASDAASAALTTGRHEVVALDVDRPDGLALLSELRRVASGASVLAFTGGVDAAVAAEARALGAEVVLGGGALGAFGGLGDRGLGATLLWLSAVARADEEHQQLVRILDTSPDAAIVVDARGTVQHVNGPALVFFGRERAELEGEPMLFVAPEGAAVELRVNRGKGERVGELRVTEITWRGEAASLASIRDVTQQRQLEMQVLMSDRLASLGTLAAGIGHEINNPLAAVVANVDRALEVLAAPPGADPEPSSIDVADVVDGLRDAREAADRIRQLTRDLKVFARTTAEEERRAVDVHRLLDSVVRMARNEVHHRARLTKSYGEIMPVSGSEARLSQVFLNLLVNAAQSIPEGNADKNEIKVVTRMAPGSRVAIDFEDTGGGIAEDVQRRLFTPFFTTKPVGSGTGLGLAISQRIIHAMGGEISFESRVGEGTRFHLLLPAAAPDPKATAPTVVVARPASGGPRKGSVLVIDDDPPVMRVLRRALDKDHLLTCCDRAAAALARIEQGERFDVILCDLMMPEMTGMDLVRALEGIAPEQVDAVILMTGGAFTAQAREFLETVSFPRLEKPFDVVRLRDVVAVGIARAVARRHGAA